MSKVLIVEDEVMLLEVTKLRLEAEGFEVDTAENGKEGLLKAMSGKPDVILADLMMPDMDGWEMIKIIRSNSDLKDVPIIILSALGREEDIQKAMDTGATDYLVKPVSSDAFLEKIQEYLT